MSDSSPAIAVRYEPHQQDAIEALEHRLDAHMRDCRADMSLIVAALARIEKRLESQCCGFEDVNARIDRLEANDIETRRQLAAMQKPTKKVKRK